MPKSIVIAGSIAAKPRHGGHTWVFLQYLLGFRRLGWDVFFLDQLDPDGCADMAGQPCSLEESHNLATLRGVMRRFGLGESWALLADRGRRIIGCSGAGLRERLGRADVLLNVMGFLRDEDLLRCVRRRVFLDIDPGFPQMWKQLGLADSFAGHDHFVTIGLNVGRSDCAIPTCGLDWVTTAQPVVLEHWPLAPAPVGAPFTSVASWRGAYGPIEYGGRVYGLRAHELRRFARIPTTVDVPFQLALDIHPADSKDRGLLEENGWSIVPPTQVAGDPWTYQQFIRNSRAEFMIAKNMYVQARSGWFSDRSICYLASGRPVVAQDTGLRDHFPSGEGLVLFSDPDEAADAVRRVTRDYDTHARAARALAESHSDSDKVLTRLIERLEL
jgi:Glycosyl transferases group 1